MRAHYISATLLTLLVATQSLAQHSDVLLQNVDDRITSGDADFDTLAWTLGARRYSDVLEEFFFVEDPGWNALANSSPDLPPGSSALPATTALEWDFLPLKIDGTAQNLFYWDGTGSVAFGALPTPDYEFGLGSLSSGFILVHGEPKLVPGAVIDMTNGSGGLHKHRGWYVDDGDGDLGTDPVDGIYLVSLRAKMTGLDRSLPLYFVFGTLGSTPQALLDAEVWVDANLDDLAPEFDADSNGDLDVDLYDLATWQQGFGTSGSGALQIAGDADFNNSINSSDLGVWRQEFGSSLANFAGASSSPLSGLNTVPEPSTLALLAVGSFGWYRHRRAN